MANSFATTVATPSKCVGRVRPSSGSDTPATDTVVRIGSGYISSAVGTKSTSTPAPLGQRRVGSQVTGVGVEVLGGAELQRVHEDRRHHDVASRRGRHP